jgi:hypothetical protein
MQQEEREHQRRRDDVERVQRPDRADRKAVDVHRVHEVAEVAEQQARQAVRREVLGPNGLDDHGQRAAREDDRRDAAGGEREVERHDRTLLPFSASGSSRR